MKQFFEKKEDTLLFRGNGEILALDPWGRNGLRVRSVFAGELKEGSVALLEAPYGEIHIEIGEREAFIQNGNLTAKLYVDRWGDSLQVSYYNQNEKLLLREISNGGALIRKARYFKPLPGGSYELKVSFEADPEEKIYGMGQYQLEIFNLKGCHLELAHRNSQASVPFYLSSKGYGFLWHNAAIGEVHFGSNTTEWTARATDQMDYWICAGDSPAQIEEQYAEVTGKSPMMPEYGLGFWQCKLRYYSQKEVLEVAREYKKRRIPIDVLIIDYYHWPRCGDWRFDEEYFPDPAAMVKELHEMGIETMVSVWPQVDVRSENYEEMKQQGLLVKTNYGIDVQMLFHGNNIFMDATNPRAREYLWKKLKRNYADLGIRAFWLDEAEPEFGTYDHDLYSYSGGPAIKMGNIYPREYARAVYEGQKKDGQEDIINLIRCAWIGSQRYGALVWSGDIMSTYEDFRKQICAGLHMGISGIPWWTTDIGGFHNGNIEDPRFRQLLVRWFQFGTFCPVMRIHGSRNPHEQIINKAGEEREWTGAPNEIWSFGDDIYPILVKFIGIREKMRDYTRELMKEAHEKGTPVIRTMFYEFPQDSECWDIKDAYMYGPDILVAPICYENAVERKVYLPTGASWICAGTGKTYEGGHWVKVEAPLQTLPVFLRDGRQGYLTGVI